jgi:UDPglucose--hexose-1-phosphate uridylyltransferase
VYHTYHERCLFCDMLHQELAMGTRVVIEGTHVVAFAPFAARSPFETWLMPRRHGAAFEHADPAELRDLARTLRIVLRKLDRALGTPPYRFLLHSAPFDTGDTPVFHWHVEVAPALLGVAPLEWSSGLHVNLMPPEDAARFLRDAAD